MCCRHSPALPSSRSRWRSCSVVPCGASSSCATHCSAPTSSCSCRPNSAPPSETQRFGTFRVAFALVRNEPLPDAASVGVAGTSWLKGLGEAASELRRHLLDRLRNGELERGEELLELMDDAYDALVTVDFPDALTGGLRRTV